jgi:hypothetical protein
MEFNLVPNYRLQECMLWVKDLQGVWGFEEAKMPKSVAVGELRLQRQLQKSLSLVTLAPDDRTLLIFKSRTRTLSGLYHEIKVINDTSTPKLHSGPSIPCDDIHSSAQ